MYFKMISYANYASYFNAKLINATRTTSQALLTASLANVTFDRTAF